MRCCQIYRRPWFSFLQPCPRFCPVSQIRPRQYKTVQLICRKHQKHRLRYSLQPFLYIVRLPTHSVRQVNKIEVEQKEVVGVENYLAEEEFLKILKEFRMTL